MNDELVDILKQRGVPAAPSEVKVQLLSATMSQLKRTRRIRKVQQGAMWTGVFLIGVSLGWLSWQRSPEQHAMQAAPRATIPEPPRLLTAAQLELQAEKTDDPIQAAQLYRQAGDRFLEANDLRSALRCYRIHLNEGGQESRQIMAHDSWLLINLKSSGLTRR